MGSRAKPKYQKLLNDVGKQLDIPVHWCLGGLASEKFRRNWEKHRREHARREAEEAEEEEDEEEEKDDEEEEQRRRDEAAAAAAAATLPESLRGRHLSANDSSVRLDDATDQNGSRQSARVFEATRAATTGAKTTATSTAAALSPSATRRTRKSATADISATGTRHLERRATAGRHVSFTNRHDDDNNDVIARGRRPRHLDTCAQFIRNMLQRHKNQRKRGGTTTTTTTTSSASSSAATPLVTDYVKTTLLNKNHRASKRLNARPKIGSLKKASQFLTLKDQSLNRLGFLALAAQHPPSPKQQQHQQPPRSRTGWGGAMVTRAATGSLPSGSTTAAAASPTPPSPAPARRRRQRTTKRRRPRTKDDDDDDDDNDEKPSKNQKRTTTAATTNKTTMTRSRGQRQRQNGNRVKFLVDDNEDDNRDGLYNDDDDDDHNDDDDNHPGKIHLSREDEAIVNRTIDAEEAESFDFLADSLLLFDDCLVPISPLDHQRLPGSTTTTTTTNNATAPSSSSSSPSSNKNNNNAARQTQNAFTEALQFFSSLALEHAHHDSLHFVVTSQSVLSSAGTSAVARCFKTLRQNIDAHIVFDQPLQDARSFFKNLVSGAGE